LNKANKLLTDHKAEADRAEREKEQRRALLAELDAIENGPREEDFSQSGTDDEEERPEESSESEIEEEGEGGTDAGGSEREADWR